jgi:hypothetical protein
VARLEDAGALAERTAPPLPDTSAEARVLADELLEYEIRVEEDANDRYGAFRVGKHENDLVTALGLAVQTETVHRPHRTGLTGRRERRLPDTHTPLLGQGCSRRTRALPARLGG